MEDNLVKIIVALMSVIGVVVTAVITYHEHKRQSWNNTVGAERIRWLKLFREELGHIMLGWETMKLSNSNVNNLFEIQQQAERAKYVLISRLNTNTYEGNEYNFQFKKMLFELQFLNGWKTPSFTEEEFMHFANLILEGEWAKIKKETKYNEE